MFVGGNFQYIFLIGNELIIPMMGVFRNDFLGGPSFHGDGTVI